MSGLQTCFILNNTWNAQSAIHHPKSAMWGAAAALFLAACGRSFAEEQAPPERAEHSLWTIETAQAVERGLEYLARGQSKNGSFGSSVQVATTSLASLSFLAHGDLPGRGKYGENIRAGLRYLLRCASASRRGFITELQGGQSRMHGHGFATLLLTELYGTTAQIPGIDHEDLKQTIRKAIRVIEHSQTSLGGWGYEPMPTYDEGSVTVCQVQALRSARNAGILVSKSVIDRGIAYLQKSANKDGSFKYSLQSGAGGGTFPLTAAATSSLCLYGMYDSPETKRGIEFLLKQRPSKVSGSWGHYFYGNFYATLAMYQAGGQHWEEWYPRLREELLSSQQQNGSWQGEYDGAYCTAFATLTLQVPTEYLPIFQK